MANPEHTFQKAAMVMAKKIITAPHRFRAFDRSKNGKGMQHLHEAQRGIRKGTPDTEIICGTAKFHSVNIELKKPFTGHLKNYQPKQDQIDEMANLRAAGAYAAVAYSCVELVDHWRSAGIPLAATADVYAAWVDDRLRVRLDVSTPCKPKAATRPPRQRNPTAADIARANEWYAVRDNYK